MKESRVPYLVVGSEDILTKAPVSLRPVPFRGLVDWMECSWKIIQPIIVRPISDLASQQVLGGRELLRDLGNVVVRQKRLVRAPFDRRLSNPDRLNGTRPFRASDQSAHFPGPTASSAHHSPASATLFALSFPRALSLANVPKLSWTSVS
jgi:hypothetical protein